MLVTITSPKLSQTVNSFTAAVQSLLGRSTKTMLKQHLFLENVRKEVLQPVMNSILLQIFVYTLLCMNSWECFLKNFNISEIYGLMEVI